MNPFLSMPIVMPDDPSNNIKGYDAKGKYLPSHFSGYAQGPTPDTIFVYLTGGQVIYVGWSMDQLEEAMKQYWAELAKQTLKQQRIVQLPGSKRN